MELSITDKDLIKIVKLKGDFTIVNLQLFQENVFPFFKDKVETIAIDMAEVNFVDSSGIGKLVQSLNLARNGGKNFILIKVTDRVLQLFKTVKLDNFFNILDYNEFERKFLR
ncbi:MAG TPA: STAS domain-containing protein [Spirochaetota bacterium]|jgi:anti-sigma B factor antagonist|nr:MAG: putative anti-sigma factor antagonist [Spirochaetes bacterium ADurb.Bin133]HOF01823.1 STAS domain-containing protein [Spirochaetota bacterium]HOS33337.1 STAS domain-containing protein [Spirochaetota bacterium]HOS56514.1 STAS domain-containing protein [Spirochaetota bacterium]HPK61778.1 STAS domain-containing protein [Spirochaetota bacterium]